MKPALLALALATPLAGASAQGAESSFPLEPLHASSVALGGAGVALPGAQFFLLNPAATAKAHAAELSHWLSPMGAQDVALSVSHGGGWGTVRVGARRRSWGDVARDLGLTDLTVAEQSIGLGFARTGANDRVAWGFSVARLDADYLGARAHAWAIDLGARANAGKGLVLGVSLLHLGTDFRSGDTPSPLPARIRPGAGWTGQIGSLRVLAAADLPFALRLDAPPDVHAGVEVGRTWGNVNAVTRAGYTSLADRDGRGSRLTKWSLGGGLRLRQISANVAYMLGGVFGPERFLSLSIHW